MPEKPSEIEVLQKRVRELERREVKWLRAIAWFNETGWGVHRPKWLLDTIARALAIRSNANAPTTEEP